MDNVHEQLIPTSKSAAYNAANFGCYGVGVLGLLMIMGNPIIGILLIAIAVGLFFLKKNLYVEYEYSFVNGEVDIDKIMEMRTRKKVVSFNAKQVELLALEDSNYVKDFSGKPDKIINAVPKGNTQKAYIAMVTGGAERFQLRFLPDEETINLYFKYCPRAVKRY